MVYVIEPQDICIRWRIEGHQVDSQDDLIHLGTKNIKSETYNNIKPEHKNTHRYLVLPLLCIVLPCLLKLYWLIVNCIYSMELSSWNILTVNLDTVTGSAVLNSRCECWCDCLDRAFKSPTKIIHHHPANYTVHHTLTVKFKLLRTWGYQSENLDDSPQTPGIPASGNP